MSLFCVQDFLKVSKVLWTVNSNHLSILSKWYTTKLVARGLMLYQADSQKSIFCVNNNYITMIPTLHHLVTVQSGPVQAVLFMDSHACKSKMMSGDNAVWNAWVGFQICSYVCATCNSDVTSACSGFVHDMSVEALQFFIFFDRQNMR